VSRPRFIADVMLGSLARWLRVLDFDTAYDRRIEDAELVERAAAEGRTLLTRDRRLLERRKARGGLLIREDDVATQLRQILEELHLTVARSDLLGRCLRCNESLVDVPAEEAREKVPPFVAATQERFRRCPACRRLYWRATHVEGMEKRIRAMGIELA
jgi:hypothetical protein